MIFSLQKRLHLELFGDESALAVPSRLVYVEWFSKFAAQPASNFQMYKVSRSFVSDNVRESEIIPAARLHRSAHLIPHFGESVPAGWTSENVLEECNDFFLNDFKDRSTHFSLF